MLHVNETMHSLRIFTSLSFTIIVFLCPYSKAGCPNPHLLTPCTCLASTSVLTCENLFNEEQLKSITAVSKGIVGVELFSVAFRYIPADAFQGLNIKFLSIKNSSILALSEKDRAFLGLEKSLKSFKVEECPFANAWEWTQLASLTKLEELEIIDSELQELGPQFLSLSKLPILTLKFLNTDIEVIPDNAFSTFKNLNKVTLDNNCLMEIRRSMFPRPAKKLTSIGLSHNRIRFLPDDLFLDMPVLKYLYLGANPLYVLDEKTFKPVWKHISMFVFHDVPLICDCRLTWITKMKNENKFIHAACANPVRLKGRKIKSLESDELWCVSQSRKPELELYNVPK